MPVIFRSAMSAFSKLFRKSSADEKVTPEYLLALATEFYVQSHDFNGLPVHALEMEPDDLRALLRPLVEAGTAYVNYGDRHPNPHILAFEPESREQQLEKLATNDLAGACLYPTVGHLESVVDRDTYRGRPYSLELALGYPALGYHFFDLSILESYRNDPRYYYSFDISGRISIHDDHFRQSTMPERDQILLESFGLALQKDDGWGVVVFRRYLSSLSPEHQQIWKAKQEDDREKFAPHPDYLRSSILGDWHEKLSLFRAVLEEMKQINALAQHIGRPPLFRNTYSENWPNDFGYLIRPTGRELANFAGALDKMLSDNINRDFFQNEVPYEDEQTDKKGRTVVTQRGTIRILDEWIKAKVRCENPELIEHAIKTLKEIRKKRNPNAHTIRPDEYNVALFKEQAKLMRDAYRALVTLRQILQLHPAARDYEVPDVLENQEVWSF
ncbi:hypothetical protein [Streptomyces sp. B93]|uniref:hypothetical protein n=1 Tax=Streptomyces sp. B93 TaxID=2824875 RepID=UPI001B389FFB|nr:hypothetical protein [Streptomyces sp. B93]MBQ1089655.1 hypothetical protein [Streptomyces sp. B93]